MSHAKKALNVLIGEDKEDTLKMAREIDSSNAERQEKEREILNEVQRQINKNPEILNERVLIFSGKNWHGGVIGIVAARLVGKYGKPCFVITDDGENAKGSARSIDGFSLYDALDYSGEFLETFGGHELAAGLVIKYENIDLFRKTPVVNDKGIDWFGTKRLKAPEEYIEGSAIDEQTNIFTLGALIFEFFGRFSEEEIQQRYRSNQFSPCSIDKWQLSEESYKVATQAVNLNKNERYQTFAEFCDDWKAANHF